jgi:hypothetical protein
MGAADERTHPPVATVSQQSSGQHRRPRKRVTSILTWSIVGVVFIGAFGAGWLTQILTRSSEPFEVTIATLLRDNNLGWAVAELEDVYFTYVDRAPVGGTPIISADVAMEDAAGLEDEVVSDIPTDDPVVTPAELVVETAEPVVRSAPALQPPPTIISPVATPQPKEGQWQPVGSKVNGERAIYVTRVRADDVHTSVYASLMWIDPTKATAMFVPGFEEPAGGPNPMGGQLPKRYHPDVLASTNGGFRLGDSLGGYYYRGTTVKPLVNGKASAVFYRDGSMRIGKWRRDFTMTDDIVAVRQNLDLIVDNGVSKVSSASDNVVWGATTDKESMTWRAAIGQRADGSIVYVVGPYMSAKGLGDTLVRAGVERAMVVDMNKYWAAGFYYRHDRNGNPQCRKLHPDIPDVCDRFLKPFKRDVFHFLARD